MWCGRFNSTLRFNSILVTAILLRDAASILSLVSYSRSIDAVGFVNQSINYSWHQRYDSSHPVDDALLLVTMMILLFVLMCFFLPLLPVDALPLTQSSSFSFLVLYLYLILFLCSQWFCGSIACIALVFILSCIMRTLLSSSQHK